MSSDPGLELISAVQTNLQIEPEWCVPLTRGFQWWPGHLSQSIWADPVTQLGSHRFARVHIESDFLRDVEESEKTLKLTSFANRLTTVSSVVFHRPARCIRLHASLCVSEANLEEVVRLGSLVLPMQAADASAKSAAGLTELLGGTPDETPHPKKGVREQGHGALAMLQVLAEQNQEPPFAADIDFKPLEDLDPRPWVMGFAGKGGLTAEFAFASTEPAFVAAASGELPGTALLQLNTDFKHPQLGDGVLIRLTLPVNLTAELINELNLLEGRDGALNADQLGGWCEDKNSPVFVTFIPTCIGRENPDWITSAIYDNAIRTKWAKALLVESEA